MSRNEGVAAVSLPSSPRCTRLVSWREPVLAGAHPRTKGTRCFAGGRRRRSDATATGRLTARVACGQATRQQASRKQDQGHPEDVRREPLRTRGACAHLAEGRWLGQCVSVVETGGPAATGWSCGTTFRLGLFDGERARAVGVTCAGPERAALTGTLAHRGTAERAGRRGR